MSTETLEVFLNWLVSVAGLSAVAVFLVEPIKKNLGWEDLHARLLAFGVAAVLGVGGSVLLKFGWYVYLEEWWPLAVAIGTAFTTVLGSQLLYKKMPVTNERCNDE